MRRFARPIPTAASARLVAALAMLALAAASSAAAATATGWYVGNGSPNRTVDGLTFQPAVVIIKADGGDSAVIRVDTMPAFYSRHLVREWGLFTNRIHDLTGDGFRVGSDPDVNAPGRTYHWIAFAEDPGWVTAGTYAGVEAPTQTIEGLGFEPAMVVLIPHGFSRCRFRTSAMPGAYSVPFGEDAENDDSLVGFTSDGFVVGSNDDANQEGAAYSYLAFAAGSGAAAFGAYTGDGEADHAIGGVGFRPEWLLTKQFGSKPGAHLTTALSGADHTLNFVGEPGFGGGIRSLDDDGFVLGAHERVNEDGQDYYWAAFADRSDAADLAVQIAVDDPAPDLGDLVTLTATLANAGPADADTARLRVDVPAGLALESFAPDPGYLADASTPDQIQLAWHVPAGEQRRVVATYTVQHGAAARVFTGRGASTAPDPDPGDNEDAATLAIPTVDLIADLGTSDASPVAGDTVVLTFGVTNGDGALDVDAAADVLVPSGMAVSGAVASHGAFDGDAGRWDVGNLPSGATATLTLDVDVGGDQDGNTLTPAMTAEGSRNDADLANNAVALPHAVGGGSDLQAAASFAPASAGPGDTVDLAAAVTNAGPDPAASFTGTVVLPPGLAYQSHAVDVGSYDGATGAWSGAALPVGATASLTVTCDVTTDDAGTVQASLAAASPETDPVPGNDAAAADLDLHGAHDLVPTASWSPAAAVAGAPVDLEITVSNQGPGLAPGAEAAIAVPAGFVHTGHTASAGAFDPDTGAWTIDDPVAVPGTQTLTIGYATPADGAGVATAAVSLAAQAGETTPGNDTATADLDLTQETDLSAAVAFDVAAADLGDAVTLTVGVTNAGPSAASPFSVAVTLPAALAYQNDIPSDGVYDADAGVWTLDAPLAAGDTAELAILAGVTGVDAATVAAAATATATGDDPQPANDTAAADLDLHGSYDLAAGLVFGEPTAVPGDTLTLVAAVGNAGPGRSAEPDVAVTLPAGLAYLDAVATAGAFDHGGGTWDLGAALDPAAAETLTVRLRVPDGASGDHAADLAITALPGDADASNDTAAASVHVAVPADVDVASVPFAEEERALLPGGPAADVLRLRLHNRGGLPATLDSVTVRNPVTGGADQATQDGHWAALRLRSRGLDRDLGGFTDGAATAGGLDLIVAPGDSVDLVVRGAAAVTVPDGVQLAPEITGAADLVFGGDVAVAGAWPVAADGVLAVDGMSAAQITVHPVGAEIFQMGSVRNLALDVTVPANGTEPDQMTKLNVVNEGTAAPGSELATVEAWADDGDGAFNPAVDAWIAELHWTGGRRWEATSLAVPVPVGGQRVFVTVDVADDALGGTVRFSLPAGDDPAIGMLSGNDGPIDAPVVNPHAQTISSTDKVILSAATIAARTVAPGESSVPLLALVARNLYAAPRRLDRLRLRNQTTGTGDPGQAALDGVCGQVRLHRDANGNGVFDGPVVDPVVASTTWDDGDAVFDGVAWELPPDEVTALFATTSVSLLGASEGDAVGAVVGSAADLAFDEDVALVAAWPLDSTARHPVDGLVAAQLACPAVPPVSLTASEGPVLALDLTVPGNGYQGDTLESLRLDNLGSARPGDIAALGLWTDDGDGVFEPGSDAHVADLTGVDATWLGLDLDLAIPAGGRRLFAGLTVADTPTDSSTVRLSVPVDGVTMASDHDGPLDAAVDSPTSLLISTAPLLSTMSFAGDRSTTDMTVTVTMRVQNVGSETVESITPSAITLTGDGGLVQLTGPEPATLDLADGSQGAFTWTYAAESAGAVHATGRCEGVSAVGGQPRGSLATASAPHRVLAPALDLALYPVANMPFSINRGQTGVVPLTLTLLNEGDDDRAGIALRRLVVTLDDGDGNPVAPAALLSRVTVGEGVNVYGDVSDPEAGGNTVTIDLAPEVVVTASEPVTLGLRLDIRPDTTVPRFRVSLESAADLTVVDHVSGLPRGVTLTDAAFPVRSAAGSIVSQATGLTVTATALDDRTAGAGQDDVELLRLALGAEGEDAGSEVKVGSFAVSVADTAGRRLADAAQRLSHLWVEGPLAVHASSGADSLVVFELSPPVTVPVGAAAVTVSVRGQLADDPVLGPLVVHLEDPDLFDARDGNVSSGVGVTYQPATIDGPRVTVQTPAPPLRAGVDGHLPDRLPQGARDVPALTLHLDHPGLPTSSAVRLDTLRLTCLDAAREPQNPDVVLDGYVVTWNGEDVGAPVLYDGADVVVPLGGRLLAPRAAGALVMRLDVEADAPAVGLELVAGADCLVARDANLLAPVTLEPAAGATLPGTSGLAAIQPAAEEVLATWTDRLPPLLPSDGGETTVARLALHNPASPGTAPAQLASLALRAADRDGQAVAAGAMAADGRLQADGVDWAVTGGVAEDDSTLHFAGAVPLLLPPGATVELELRVTPRAAASGGVRFGVRADDLACVQTDGATPVPVRAGDGVTLPFWTAASGVAAGDLAASYVNFPNPFAAGRQTTRFAFQLPRAGRVTLRIWTPRGEPVTTVLDDRGLAAGLHQDLAWDGRNGRGTVVRNGVYLAELEVTFDDGGRERLLRKVAVVR